MTSSWFDVGGASGLRVAWEDRDRIFYRGWRNGADGDRNPVFVVIPAAEQPTPDGLNRLMHEYGLRDDLDVAWAARPVALTHYNDRMTLVLEHPGGTPAGRLLGRPLDVSHFLRIAIPLAVALRQVHERGLVHKDIKPANILVDPAGGGVWLTGFGIASRLPREHQAPAPPEVIAGTPTWRPNKPAG
jgi:serine/threonine protein kinase